MKLRSASFLFLACLSTALLGGCALVAASGDIDDGSAEKTTAKDQEERMRRLRGNGSLRPEEYDALENKMSAGKGGDVSAPLSVAELEKRVEERRRQREEAKKAE
jgi:hypothetical protein